MSNRIEAKKLAAGRYRFTATVVVGTKVLPLTGATLEKTVTATARVTIRENGWAINGAGFRNVMTQTLREARDMLSIDLPREAKRLAAVEA